MDVLDGVIQESGGTRLLQTKGLGREDLARFAAVVPRVREREAAGALVIEDVRQENAEGQGRCRAAAGALDKLTSSANGDSRRGLQLQTSASAISACPGAGSRPHDSSTSALCIWHTRFAVPLRMNEIRFV